MKYKFILFSPWLLKSPVKGPITPLANPLKLQVSHCREAPTQVPIWGILTQTIIL